mgnify:CR=1 FL=1
MKRKHCVAESVRVVKMEKGKGSWGIRQIFECGRYKSRILSSCIYAIYIGCCRSGQTVKIKNRDWPCC